MKYVLILLTALLVGCNETKNSNEILAEDPKFDTICLDGVEYWYAATRYLGSYKGYGFMAARYKQDGSIVTCKGKWQYGSSN